MLSTLVKKIGKMLNKDYSGSDLFLIFIGVALVLHMAGILIFGGGLWPVNDGQFLGSSRLYL